MTEKKTIIEVIMMNTDFFLYLPFYYAESENFFDYLPDGYEVRLLDRKRREDDRKKGIIHDEYDTDEKVCEALLDSKNRTNGKNYYLAIADPTKIITQGQDLQLNNDFGQLMILATLVTNTAFWAISHTKEIKHLGDLGEFKKIISYPKGTTSYGLACRLLNLKQVPINTIEFNPSDKIFAKMREIQENHNLIIIDPTIELDFFTYLKNSNDSFALSPDVLRMVRYESIHNCTLKRYMLGKSTEFNDLIVTTLIAHQAIKTSEVTKEKWQQLVRGILRGIQQAMLQMYYIEDGLDNEDNSKKRSIREKLVSLVLDNFTERKPSRGDITEALRIAIEGRIFPRLIEITEAEWENAVSISLMAKKEQIQSSDDWKKYSELALQSYENSIKPYQQYSSHAIKQEIYQPIFEEIPELTTQNDNLTQTNPLLKGINMKEIWEKIWQPIRDSNLPNSVKGLIALAILALLGYFGVSTINLQENTDQPTPPIVDNDELQNYTVNVEVDGQPTGGIEVKYQIDETGNQIPITIESGGAKKFKISSTTQTIKFFVQNEKYEPNPYIETVSLNDPTKTTSHTISLKTKQTGSSSSSTNNFKIKSIKITVKKKLEDGGGIVPDATVILTGTNITGRFNKQTNSEGIVEWDEPHIDGNAPQLQINDKVTVEIIKEGWKVENPNLSIAQPDYVESITLKRK